VIVTKAKGTVREILALVTDRPPHLCANRELLLERDLGVDSLALLEVVETLQERLAILIPDEVTARLRTVADLQDAVTALVADPSLVPPRTRS
jgi:acyl carrier protein